MTTATSAAAPKSDQGTRPSALNLALLGLSGAATLAIAIAAFGNRTPQPEAVQWQKLHWPGHSLGGTVVKAASRSRHLAHGDVMRLEVAPRDGAAPSAMLPSFVVTLAAVRARSHEHLYLSRFREEIDALKMQAAEPAKPAAGARRESNLQFGTIEGKPTAQACITRTGAVTADTAHVMADIASWQASGPRARVNQFLGLADPIPWDCVFVSISLTKAAEEGEAQDAARDALEALWSQWTEAWVRVRPWIHQDSTRK